MAAERSVESMLVAVGYGLGQLAAHDQLRRQSLDDAVVVVSALDLAVTMEQAGFGDAAAAIREGVDDVKARAHRDPFRGGDGLVDGDVAAASALPQLPANPETGDA